MISECPSGSFGIECRHECPTGYYGKNCRFKCNCNKNEWYANQLKTLESFEKYIHDYEFTVYG